MANNYHFCNYIFANYEKQHSVQTYSYLKENDLLITKLDETKETMPKEEIDKIVNKLKDMYQKQDNNLIKILKLVAKKQVKLY